ncbi:MAG TPA: hypothetical protein DC058_11050 [Planctomycetaceae bacterium]|nr:hypothetical protein [Planctomycetaceae bacterium]
MAQAHAQPQDSNPGSTYRHLPPREGAVLGNLKLIRQLGAGQEGRVWKAEHVTRGLPCAVKFLAPQLMQDPAAQNHFVRTFKAIQEKLSDQRQIARMGGLTENSQYGSWYWMEYINHVNLKDFVQERTAIGRPLSRLQICELLLPIAQTLDVAHSRSILHCDVNPRHLMVELKNDGRTLVRLIDFGEAILLDEDDSLGPLQRWPAGGTAGYISPERIQGQQQCGRTDQYSLAIVLAELVLGYSPNPAATPAQVLDTIDRLPEEAVLRQILMRGLQANAGGRYSSCTELLTAVQAAVSADQPLSGSLLQTYAGLQRQKRGTVTEPPPFWRKPDFLPRARTNDPRRDHQELEELVNQLQAARQELQRQLSRLQEDPVKVGIVGTRNAGKSTLLAVWNLFRNSPRDGVDLVISDDATAAYLKSLAQELLEQGVIRANAYAQPPQYLQLHVTVHGQSWKLTTCDFTGEYLNSETNSESAEAAGTLDFLRQADMIIFLYDPHEQDPKILDHIDKLFHQTPPELVLALTKIDQHWDSVAEMTRFPRFYQKLCRDFPTMQQVDSKLSLSFSSSGLRIIPISSFGKRLQPATPKDRTGPQLKVHDLSPYQIFSPLAAAFQRRADNVQHLHLQLEQLQQLEEALQKRLTNASQAAGDRQRRIDGIANELQHRATSVSKMLGEPKPEVLQSLKKHQERLTELVPILRDLKADQQLQQCVNIIGEVNSAIDEFPFRRRNYVIQNQLKILTEANQQSSWLFLAHWVGMSCTVSRLYREVNIGVDDQLRAAFSQQHGLYIQRSIKLAGVIIGSFVLFFLILLVF